MIKIAQILKVITLNIFTFMPAADLLLTNYYSIHISIRSWSIREDMQYVEEEVEWRWIVVDVHLAKYRNPTN